MLVHELKHACRLADLELPHERVAVGVAGPARQSAQLSREKKEACLL